MKIQILELAKDDLIDGYHYYETIEGGLGEYFLSCLYSDIEALQFYAGSHRIGHAQDTGGKGKQRR